MFPSSITNSESTTFGVDSEGLVTASNEVEGRHGQTVAVIVVFLFLLPLVLTGIIDLCWPLPEPNLLGDEAARVAAARKQARFADGSLARLVETEWRATSRVRGVVGSEHGYQLFRWLNEASGDVVGGRDGWLFFRSRIKIREGNTKTIAKIASAQWATIGRRLAAKHVRFIVIPIPRKSVSVVDLLPRGADPHVAFESDLLAQASLRNVECVDLMPVFTSSQESQAYYKWDTHWKLETARMSAREVCLQSGILTSPESRRFKLIERENVQEKTDLLGYIGISSQAQQRPIFSSRKEKKLDVWAPRNASSPKKKWDGRDAQELVLCGTSFSQDSVLWKFLSYYCDQKVEDASLHGVWPRDVLFRFLERRIGDLPKILFWEVPVYSITMPRGADLTYFRRIYDVLKPQATVELTEVNAKASIVAPAGVFTVTPQWRFLAQWQKGAVTHDGKGTVLVKIEGRGLDLELGIRCGDAEYSLKNVNLAGEPLLFPVLTDGQPCDITVGIRSAPRKQGQLFLQRVTLCADLDRTQAAELAPGKTEEAAPGHFSRSYMFRDHSDVGPRVLSFRTQGRGVDFTLEIESESGGMIRRVDISAIPDQGTVLVDLPRVDGSDPQRVVLSWRGDKNAPVQQIYCLPINK